MSRPSAFRDRDAHFGELLRVLDRQRPEPHRIQELEDRRVGADAERQRQNRDERERGIQTQQAQAMAHVLHDCFERGDGVHAIDLLADARRVAELAPRGEPRLVGRHAAGDVVVGFNGEMRLELTGALIVPAAAAEEAADRHGRITRAAECD